MTNSFNDPRVVTYKNYRNSVHQKCWSKYKSKNYKSQRRKHRYKSLWPWIRQRGLWFLDMTPKAQVMKEKINWTSSQLKLKAFCPCVTPSCSPPSASAVTNLCTPSLPPTCVPLGPWNHLSVVKKDDFKVDDDDEQLSWDRSVILSLDSVSFSSLQRSVSGLVQKMKSILLEQRWSQRSSPGHANSSLGDWMPPVAQKWFRACTY